MHKSTLTFGLLASSLVMLVIMPVLNQNNSFFNVMAQEYDKYGDSHYSQYPTDDKKYECRTGPFEGFFVSSVEFCKHVKFDDKKEITEIIKQEPKVHLVHKVQQVQLERQVHQDTRSTGIQGTKGLMAQGPGIQGPPGITQLINGTNVYLVTRSADSSTISVDVTAPCEAGDFVINGGYLFSGSVGANTIVSQNGPIISPPGEGWRTGISFLPIVSFPSNTHC